MGLEGRDEVKAIDGGLNAKGLALSESKVGRLEGRSNWVYCSGQNAKFPRCLLPEGIEENIRPLYLRHNEVARVPATLSIERGPCASQGT